MKEKQKLWLSEQLDKMVLTMSNIHAANLSNLQNKEDLIDKRINIIMDHIAEIRSRILYDNPLLDNF
jgi:hypothetical protein